MQKYRPLEGILRQGGYLIRELFIGEANKTKFYIAELFYREQRARVIAIIEPGGNIKVEGINPSETQRLDRIYEEVIKRYLQTLVMNI